jgi:AcrR family transcriptional regulator
MARWEPDAAGRLTRAALDLFLERGFERTTVGDIAERAGVTERTFFRHFADKREALFDSSHALEHALVDAVDAAPAAASPVEAVGVAFETAAALLEDRRDFARRRAAAIAAHPSLQERELLKLSGLAEAAAEALRRRGVPDPAAALAAEAGVVAFKLGFERWIGSDSSGSLARDIRATRDELVSLAAGTDSSS